MVVSYARRASVPVRKAIGCYMSKLERRQEAHRIMTRQLYEIAGQMLRDKLWCEKYACFHAFMVMHSIHGYDLDNMLHVWNGEVDDESLKVLAG